MRMRAMMLTAVGLAVGLAAGGGCKPKEQVEAEAKATKVDLDQMQGRWKFASRSGDADPDADEPAPTLQYVIEGDIMKVVLKDDVLYRQKLGVIAGKEPKQVDLSYVTADGKPETVTGTTRSRGKTKKKTTALKDVAIYKVEGDKLIFCVSGDDKKRPPEFTAPPGSNRWLLTLERIKDGAKPDADEPKTEPTKTDTAPATKAEGPKTIPPAVELPNAPKVDAPRVEAPDAPKTPTADTPKVPDAPVVPKPDALKPAPRRGLTVTTPPR